MPQGKFIGAISALEEFFYPDTTLSVLPDSLSLHMARNEAPGIQLLLKTGQTALDVRVAGDFEAEIFQMLPIPVEYNTGDGEEQGGAMVLTERPKEKPAYCTRLAPFFVYDCLKPAEDGRIMARDGAAAVYVCLRLKAGLPAGEYSAVLTAGDYHCGLAVTVYDVMIPEDTFPVTNWFSLDAIARFHGAERGSQGFLAMLRRYADAMRRIHQTMFYFELDETCVVSRAPYAFSFDYLEDMIRCFFDAGMQTLEIGPLLSRGLLPNGMPDMYTADFKCAMAKDLSLESAEGYAVTTLFIRTLAAFLQKHGWQDKVVFHIHDEPDIHMKDGHTLSARRRQYYLAASLLRRYLPGVRVIEAVGGAAFRGGVDIWVPGTAGYEAEKQAFDRLIALGEEVWSYVCCGPEGHWLNRFLDFALIKGRLLFWGCAANRLSGFLHWGFNQFQLGMDPFKASSCPNHTGIGTNFPCGDAFIVYPGEDGPWPGMRMEAARRGAEDAALLGLLYRKDAALHDRLVGQVFRTNTDYEADPERFEAVRRQVLAALAQP